MVLIHYQLTINVVFLRHKWTGEVDGIVDTFIELNYQKFYLAISAVQR